MAAKWLNDAVFYEIYPQSFYDTNGDGIGDIQGIIEKLDYIKGLGCNALWINPCFDSPFKDAGYDVRDYKKVAPRYGTNEDLVELFNVAHKKGIRVLLDLVPGHTSEEHEWFRMSQKAEKNEYSDRFIWTDFCFAAAPGFPYIGGESERSGTYVLNFFKCQPALNYGFFKVDQPWQKPMNHPAAIATREAIKDIMRFWLSRGCDGFRVDMASSLVKNDDEKKTGTSRIWRDVRRMLDLEFPEAAMVSEWSNPSLALRAGYDCDFYLNEPGSGYSTLMRDYYNHDGEDHSYFKKDAGGDINRFLDQYLDWYNDTKDLGYISLITCNHDTIRPRYNLDESELKLAYATIFTLPGVPFLYYGDEIGMRYQEIPTKEGGYYFVVVACSEEGAKYFMLKRNSWNSDEFNCQFDGIVYAVFVSLGFALWENISYVLHYGFSVALIRALTAIPGHTCFGVFMGLFYGVARKFENRGETGKAAQFRWLSVIVPAVLHGAYDYIASVDAGTLLFVVFIAALFFVSYRIVSRMSKVDHYI